MKAWEGGVKFGGKIDKNTVDGLFAHEEEKTYTLGADMFQKRHVLKPFS